LSTFFIRGHRFQILLFVLFAYIVIGPFFFSLPYASAVANILLTSALFMGVYVVQSNRKIKITSFILLCVTLLPLWIAIGREDRFSLEVTYFVMSVYLFILIYTMFFRIINMQKVSSELIFLSLCLYLNIGLFWGVLYACVDFYLPGAFGGGILDLSTDPLIRFHVYMYYSFTTLTTLGYGDIVPKIPTVAGLCQGEAIIGQFFTAVLISQLVGVRIAEKFIPKNKK
jgi:voltage-gated potassium channel